jgi:hypothetical protein
MLIGEVEVPRIDVPPAAGGERSRITPLLSTPAGRRSVVKGLLVGAMTLSGTIVSWVPLARPASATVGTEYLSCDAAGYTYNGSICIGAPTSATWCGNDKWFKDGCFRQVDGFVDCFQPIKICGINNRNAWRWSGHRCADGQYKPSGGSWVTRICNATL